MADMMSNANGLTPVYNVGGDRDDGFFGNSGMIVFFLFFLLCWGGGFVNVSADVMLLANVTVLKVR